MAAKPEASEKSVVSEEPDVLAKRLFREQRYPEAALEFERLWSEQRTPKYLFNAAMAREMMGHELLAFVHLQVFVGIPGLPDAELTRAKDRIQALRERTIKLRVKVAPADLPPGTLTLDARRPDDPVASLSPSEARLDGAMLIALAVPGAPGAYDLPVEVGRWDLEFSSQGYLPGRTSVEVTQGLVSRIVVRLVRLTDTVDVTAEFMPGAALAAGIDVLLKGPAPLQVTKQRVERSPITWRLKPGAWTLEAKAAGYQSVRRVFTTGAEPVRLQVQLAQAPRRGRRLGLGLGVAGGVTAVTGAVILGVAVARWGGPDGRREALLNRTRAYVEEGTDKTVLNNNWDEANAAIVRNWYSTNAGAGVLGAGLGLGIGAAATRTPHSQGKILVAQLSVGALVVVGGSVAYGFVLEAEGRQLTAIADATRTPWNTQNEVEKSNDALTNLKRRYAEGIIASALLGVGVGLVTNGVVRLVSNRKTHPRERGASIRPYYAVDGVGFVWRTQF